MIRDSDKGTSPAESIAVTRRVTGWLPGCAEEREGEQPGAMRGKKATQHRGHYLGPELPPVLCGTAPFFELDAP